METPPGTGPHGADPDPIPEGAGPGPTTPPYVPIRAVRWPTRRTPRWLLAAAVPVLAVAVLVGIAVHPSRSQRATDLNGFLTDMNTDIESCAGGVSESLTVLHAIESGTSHNVQTAIGVATYGASNCSPANSMPLDDLAQYQVQESLTEFGLGRVVNGLLTWAFPDAQRVQDDVATELRDHGAARTAANAALQRDLRVLNAQRAYLDKIMMTAIRATAASGHPPPLPG
jgi:hypothetical protein